MPGTSSLRKARQRTRGIEMDAWQVRVVKEKKELDEKIQNLSAFLQNESFMDIAQEDVMLLSLQLSSMRMYANILQARIMRFQESDRHG